MSRSVRRERREPKERPLHWAPTPDHVVDEVTAARNKRAFPLEDYPLATSKDLVILDSGRVVIGHRPGDTLVILP